MTVLDLSIILFSVSTSCLKNSQNCFCHNYVKFSPILIIFGTKMAKMIELCKMHSFSISPNLCQRTTIRKTNAPLLQTLSCCLQ